MKLKHFIIIALLCAGASGLAFMLAPSQSEVALMHMRDKDFATALEGYEAAYAAGKRDVSTLGTLKTLYLQNGEVNRAIDVLEEYLEQRPNDLQARRELGVLYLYAQRTEDYVRNLEILTSMAPNRDNLNELSKLYDYRADYQKETDTLKLLVDEQDEQAAQLFQLVQLLASMDRKPEAVDYMLTYSERYPEQMSGEKWKLLFSLMMDTGRNEDAVAIAKALSEKEDRISDLPFYATELAALGDYESAVGILAPHGDKYAEYPRVFVALLRLQRAAAYNDAAKDLLDGIYENDRDNFPQTLAGDYASLLMEYGDTDPLPEIVSTYPLEQFEQRSLLNLAGLALEKDQEELHAALVDASKESLRTQYPVYDAGLVLGGEDLAAKLALMNQMSLDSMNGMQRGYYAIYLNQRGFAKAAREPLKSLPVDDPSLDSLYPKLALGFVDSGMSDAGMAWFKQVGVTRNPKIDAYRIGFLYLVAARGDEKRVVEILESNQVPSNERVLLDLFYIAQQHGHYGLMTDVAERHIALFPESEDAQENLTYAYLKNNQPFKALAMIEQGRSFESLKGNEIYYQALSGVMKKKGAHRHKEYALAKQKYVQLLQARHQNTELAEKERQAALYALLNMRAYSYAYPVVRQYAYRNPDRWGDVYIGHAIKKGDSKGAMAYIDHALKTQSMDDEKLAGYVNLMLEHGQTDKALPYLEQLALDRGENWMFAYEEAMDAQGMQVDFVPVWLERANRSNVSDGELQTLAYKLADAGEQRAAAEILFRTVRYESDYESGDMEQLLYLWDQEGVTPGGAEWLIGKAENAPDSDEQAFWMGQLNRLGMEGQTIRIVETAGSNKLDGDVVYAYIRALTQAQDDGRLARVLGDAAAQENDPERLAFYANTAYQVGLLEDARTGLERLIAMESYDAYALRDLGDIYYFQGNHDIAQKYYYQYLDQADTRSGQGDYVKPDYLVHLRLGLIHRRKSEERRATEHFEEALRKLESIPATERTRATRLAEAKALFHIGDDTKADARYRALMQQYPGDREVAGDYAEFMIQQGRLREARMTIAEALATQSNEPIPLGNGRIRNQEKLKEQLTSRLQLLNAESLMLEGDLDDAMVAYKQLEAQYPDAMLPRLGQANIYNADGYWYRALEKLDEAHAMAPENVEVKRMRDFVRNQHRTSFRAGVEWRDTEQQEEGFTYLAEGRVLTKKNRKFGVKYEHADIEMANVFNEQGAVINHDDTDYRAELYGEVPLENGNLIRGGILASNSGPGLTGGYTMPGYRGPLTFSFDYNRAFWEIGQGFVVDAARDRLEVRQQSRFGTDWFGFAALSGNRYTIDGDEEAGKSVGLNANVGYRLRPFGPEMSLVYGADFEYFEDDTGVFFDAGNNPFVPFPVVSREVHSLSLVFNGFPTDVFYWNAYTGYAFDRLGAHGAFGGGELNYLITPDLLSTLRGSTALNSADTGDRINRAGFYMTVMF
jgi:Flp pilus assembly protein TadD